MFLRELCSARRGRVAEGGGRYAARPRPRNRAIGIGRVRAFIYQGKRAADRGARTDDGSVYIARRARDRACARPITRSMSRFRIDKWTYSPRGTRAMRRRHPGESLRSFSRDRLSVLSPLPPRPREPPIGALKSPRCARDAEANAKGCGKMRSFVAGFGLDPSAPPDPRTAFAHKSRRSSLIRISRAGH